MKQKQYHETKIKPIIQIVAAIVHDNPEIVKDKDFFMATLAANIPALKDKSKCANCDASMAQYTFEFDFLDCMLLYGMSRELKNRLAKGMPFTDANKIHVPQLSGLTLATRCRTTQMSKLAFVAKVKVGKKQVPGTWCITKDGFAALRDEQVRKRVTVFRGQIIDRHEGEMTTMSRVITEYRAKFTGKRPPKNDLRGALADYDPQEWVHITGQNEGSLF